MDLNLRNRIWNSSNPHQGPYRRTLCVCSAGLLRSPTLAVVLSQPPYSRNTRAAGSEESFALVPVDQVLLSWAAEIVFVSSRNHESLSKKFDLKTIDADIYVLDVPDAYAYRDPALIKAIQEQLVKVGFPYGETGEIPRIS